MQPSKCDVPTAVTQPTSKPGSVIPAGVVHSLTTTITDSGQVGWAFARLFMLRFQWEGQWRLDFSRVCQASAMFDLKVHRQRKMHFPASFSHLQTLETTLFTRIAHPSFVQSINIAKLRAVWMANKAPFYDRLVLCPYRIYIWNVVNLFVDFTLFH